jgi:hypothetical protein
MKQFSEFNCGDIVCSTGAKSLNTRYKVTHIYPTHMMIQDLEPDNRGARHSYTIKINKWDLFMIFKDNSIGDAPCAHDWKLYQGFRYNEWECTKCAAKKEYSIYKENV